MRDHFQNVQALRGVACLMVVVFHLGVTEAKFGLQTPGVALFKWFGYAGVDLFFVLSGFIITATNRRDLGRPKAVQGYLRRRFWRIYPTYWAALAVSAAIPGLLFGRHVYAECTPLTWAGWGALAPIPNTFVGQAWSLSFELMFYLVFGAVMVLPARWVGRVLCGWGAAVTGYWLAEPARVGVWWLPLSPYVLEFLGGCLVAWLAGRGVRRFWRAALVVGLVYAVAGIVLAKVGVLGPAFDPLGLPRDRVLVFGPPAVLIVYAFVAAEGRWPKQVPGWLLRSGDASYSLYLLHPAVLLLGQYVGVLVPHSRLPHTLWLAGTLAAVLASGFAFHALVERPLLNLGKRRKPVPQPSVAPELPARRAA